MSISTKRIIIRIKRLLKKLKNVNWNDPVNILIVATVLVIPFVAKLYFMTGLLLGLLLTISVLWTISKCPLWIRKLIVKNPILSDFLLSTLALFGVGSLFGSGLTLGIGAVICGILLGFCIPNININPEARFV